MLVMSNLQQHYMIRKLANKSLMPMIEALGIKRKNFDDKALPLCYNQLKAYDTFYNLVKTENLCRKG